MLNQHLKNRSSKFDLKEYFILFRRGNTQILNMISDIYEWALLQQVWKCRSVNEIWELQHEVMIINQ